MTKMVYSLWCGISITAGMIGLGSVAKFGDLNLIQQFAVGLMLVLLMLGCGFFGWMMADEQAKEKAKKENKNEE